MQQEKIQSLELHVHSQTAGQSEATIQVEKLSKHFRFAGETIKAVDEVSFRCQRGQFVTITGPSGCGKSTLLYMLGSLERATSGEAIVAGVDLSKLSGAEENRFRRSKIGFVFQSFHLVPNLSALENVMLPMELARVSRAKLRERARELLLEVGIEENRHQHRPGKLSGGQQQRVAIARALANDPAVLLADEPTGNLDAKNSKRIVELLRELARKGRTVVVVTHERTIARQADQRIALEDGRIVALE